MAFTDASRATVGNPTTTDDHDNVQINTEWLREKADLDHDFDISTGDGAHNPGLFFWNGVVHPSDESADYTTLQAGDDDLDAGAYTMMVRTATYGAGLVVSTNNASIYVAPGTVIQGAVTLSGQNVTLRLGAGCDIQATLTLSGAGAAVLCENGCTFDEVDISGDRCRFDGGGLDTLIDGGTSGDALDITGSDVVVRDVSLQTTAGGGNAYDAIHVGSAALRTRIEGVKVVDSDNRGIYNEGAGTKIESCHIVDSDATSIETNARAQIRGNRIDGGGGDGIYLAGSGDNSQVVGNSVGSVGAEINVTADAENCVVTGNIVNGTITDSSGTSTVSGNESY